MAKISKLESKIAGFLVDKISKGSKWAKKIGNALEKIEFFFRGEKSFINILSNVVGEQVSQSDFRAFQKYIDEVKEQEVLEYIKTYPVNLVLIYEWAKFKNQTDAADITEFIEKLEKFIEKLEKEEAMQIYIDTRDEDEEDYNPETKYDNIKYGDETDKEEEEEDDDEEMEESLDEEVDFYLDSDSKKYFEKKKNELLSNLSGKYKLEDPNAALKKKNKLLKNTLEDELSEETLWTFLKSPSNINTFFQESSLDNKTKIKIAAKMIDLLENHPEKAQNILGETTRLLDIGYLANNLSVIKKMLNLNDRIDVELYLKGKKI